MNLKENNFYNEDSQARNLIIPKLAILLGLGSIVWVTNFCYSGSFGLYEDDWVRIPTIVELSWGELFHRVIFETGGQGRPFHDGLIFLFSYIGIKLGGLKYAYAIGFVIVTINAYLFYTFLEKVYHNRVFSITGALTFCLFPADSTRDYLTHSLGVQPSLAFLLTALHLYVSGRKKLSYLVVFLCLVAYEPLFTVFFVAPLFDRQWDPKLPRQLFRHGVILVAVILCAGILRKLASENQISNFSPLSIVLLVLNPIMGPITSLAMLVYRPIETLLKLNVELAFFSALAAIGFVCLLAYLQPTPLDSRFTVQAFDRVKRFSKIPDLFKPYAKPLITGSIALMLAYPLAMTTYGFANNGRTARVHAPAIIGVSILSACICSAILLAANKHNRQRLAVFGLAGFFALLVGFGMRVQQDYQLMWQHQRGFWTDVVRLCPDLNEGTVIFVEPSGLIDTRQQIPFRSSRGVSDPKQIKGIEWELPHVFPYIYQFPTSWKIPPKVFRLQSDWEGKLLTKENLFHVSAAIDWISETEAKREIESTNVIWLETNSGKLTRRIAPLTIGDRQLKLKQLTLVGLPQFDKKYFYNYLVQAPTEQPIDYLIPAVPSTNKKIS
jgi:hypothetical protein